MEIHPATLTARGGAATIRSRIVTGEREHARQRFPWRDRAAARLHALRGVFRRA